MSQTRRALIIDPNSVRSHSLATAIEGFGIESDLVGSALDGWRSFARNRHTHVFSALESGDRFLRKLHSEYVGTLPSVFVTTSFPEEIESDSHMRPDAYIVWPIAESSLQQILRKQPGSEDSTGQQIARLHDLCELTILGPDLAEEIDALVVRMTLGFQATNSVMWGPENDSFWPRSAHPLDDSTWPQLRRQCLIAAKAQATVLVSLGPSGDTICKSEGKSLMAVSIGPAGEDLQTGICLISDDSKHFSAECGNCIQTLSRRLTKELAWVSAHSRLLGEHEQLRQTALFDPMLSVWTRAAFQQEIAKAVATGLDPTLLTVALFDFTHLRGINDRFGHSIGDAVLVQFANELKTQLEVQDPVGRFGGDELIVLFNGSTLEETTEKAQAITDHLAQSPLVREGVSIPIEVQCGVARMHAGESNCEGIFARVRIASDEAGKSSSSVSAVETNPEVRKLVLEDDSLIALGSTLGGMYRILHEINRGAMGIVYRGEDLGLGRPVAIKVLRADLSRDEELVGKFRSEAALLASLRHPNLVQVFSFGTEQEAVYFVMELVEGEPVSKIARRWALEGEYINLQAVGTIVEEIADALDAIHSLGIVHRDVKPENVLIDRINDRAVLVDVGIAKRVGDARDAAGTPGYAAPESFMAADETPVTDVYGLAATAYAMLTGSAPYVSDNLDTLIRQQLTEPIAPPSQIRTDISTAVDQVLAKALHPTPARRFRSANALAAALTWALAKVPTRRESAPVAHSIPKAFTEAPTIGEIPIPTYQVSVVEPSSSQPGSSQLSSSQPSSSQPSSFQPSSSQENQTRGAVFRVTSKVLGKRLGTTWLSAMSRADTTVGELLKPTLAAESWHASTHLLWILQCVPEHASAPQAVIRQIGATLAQSTLSGFLGDNLNSYGAGALLKAAESYWSRYHTWGQLSVTAHASSAQIALAGAPKSPMLGELLAGMFGYIPVLAGAKSASCLIIQPTSDDGQSSLFAVKWNE